MATRTTAQSGVISDTANWVGGIKPTSADSVVFAAGHAMIQDEDLTCLDILITDSVTTPASLTVTDTPGTYTLTTTASAGIRSASYGTRRGRLFAGSAETPLPNNVKWHIDLGASSKIGSNVIIDIYCTQPTNRFVLTTDDAAIGATELFVDTDVTGDIWAVGDVIEVVNPIAGSSAANRQRTTIASISSTSITLTDALTAAKVTGTHIIRVTRNVRVTYPGTGNAIETCKLIADCEIRQTSTTMRGCALAGISADFAGYFDGVVSGFAKGVDSSSRATISGIIAGCTTGITESSSPCYEIMLSGMVIGCNTGVNSTNLMGDGSIVGCSLGMQSMNTQFAGTISGCYDNVFSKAGVLPRTKLANAARSDIQLYRYNLGGIVGYGTSLKSSTQGYVSGDVASTGRTNITIYDIADSAGDPQPGYIGAWTAGGSIKSEVYATGTHGTPPVTLAIIHRMAYVDAAYTNWVEWPITGAADKEITVTLYVKSAQAGMTSRPRIAICDPSYPFESEDEILASSTASDNTDWQTLTVTYTPTYAQPLTVRLSGTNVSGTSFAFVDIAVEGEGGGSTETWYAY